MAFARAGVRLPAGRCLLILLAPVVGVASGRRRLRGVAVVAAVVLLVPSTALASGGWSAPVSIDSTRITSVSCPSASFCAAVDVGGYALTSTDPTGGAKAWKQTAAPVDGNGGLTSISCPSTSFCVAVDGSGNAVTYDNGSWSAPANIAPLQLNSVSCLSASFCAAVTGGGSGTGASALTYDGSSWTAAGNLDPTGSLYSVSCASTSFCVAGGDGAGDSFGGGTAWIYNGGSWSGMGLSDPYGLASVSCPSPSFCAAVDSGGSALTYSGGSWSAPADIGGTTQFISVSCPSEPSTFCAAVDSGMNAFTYSGGSWSAPASIDTSSYALQSVSCSSASFCAAVDGAGNLLTFTRPCAGTWMLLLPSGRGGHALSVSVSVVHDGRRVHMQTLGASSLRSRSVQLSFPLLPGTNVVRVSERVRPPRGRVVTATKTRRFQC